MSNWVPPDSQPVSRVPQVHAGRADEKPVISSVDATMRQLVDHVVDGVPGVTGALIASVDGFVLASRLPTVVEYDESALAAMSAAMLGLANRLVRLGGVAPVEVSHHRSELAQVSVFAVGGSAALTIIATSDADANRVDRVGREVAQGLLHAFDQS